MRKIILLDDHKIYTDMMVSQLQVDYPLHQLVQITHPTTLIDNLNTWSNHIDLIICDLEMGEMNGIDVLKECNEQNYTFPFLMVSMYNNDIVIEELKQNGAKGFMHKGGELSELKLAITSILNGGTHFPITKRINISTNNLSKREVAVIKELSEGKTAKEMVDTLFISEATIRTHIRNILRKTDMDNMRQVVSYAQKEGLFLINDK